MRTLPRFSLSGKRSCLFLRLKIVDASKIGGVGGVSRGLPKVGSPNMDDGQAVLMALFH